MYFEGVLSYSSIVEVLNLIHTLSHEQAVKRGFSVNKSLLIPNLQKEGLTS